MRSWSVIHSGSVSFHHSISLAAAPSPAGRCGVHQAASARLSVRSVASVCGWVHTSSLEPSGCLSYCALHVRRITFLHLLRVPCGTGQPCLFRAAIICGFFRCPKKFAFVGATSHACESRWRFPASQADCGRVRIFMKGDHSITPCVSIVSPQFFKEITMPGQPIPSELKRKD